jgi:hypothetical protein
MAREPVARPVDPRNHSSSTAELGLKMADSVTSIHRLQLILVQKEQRKYPSASTHVGDHIHVTFINRRSIGSNNGFLKREFWVSFYLPLCTCCAATPLLSLLRTCIARLLAPPNTARTAMLGSTQTTHIPSTINVFFHLTHKLTLLTQWALLQLSSLYLLSPRLRHCSVVPRRRTPLMGHTCWLHTRVDSVGHSAPPCASGRCTVTRRTCSPPPHVTGAEAPQRPVPRFSAPPYAASCPCTKTGPDFGLGARRVALTDCLSGALGGVRQSIA